MSESPQRPTDRAIFQKLDDLHRDTTRQLGDLQKDMTRQIDELKVRVTEIEGDSKETRKILTGDGVENAGVVLRLKDLEQSAASAAKGRRQMNARMWGVGAAVGSMVLIDIWPKLKNIFSN